MRVWRRIPGSRSLFVSIAIRPIDDFTGGPPIVRIETALDRQDGARWIPLDIEPVATASGILGYAGLGKVANPAVAPLERYRVRVVDPEDRGIYRPAYRFTLDGLEFDVAPWNDTQPPAMTPAAPETVFLSPAPNYPFPQAIAVLRGRTIDAGGQALADARVATSTDHVLSDERGAFALPIRLSAPAASILVIADHARTGTSASVNVALPGGLAAGIDLQLV